MMILLLLGVSFIAAAILAFVGDRKFAPEINIVCSLATFAISIALGLQVYYGGSFMAGGNFFFIDAFNVYLVVLTSFVSMTTAIFSRRYMRREREHGRVGHWGMRFYHAMFQLFIFAMLLCLLTNNLGVLWIAMELATLSTVLLVSLYRTPTAIDAAWKYFILCGVGIALALFGTVLIYFAAENKLGGGRDDTLLWTVLHGAAGGGLDPAVITLAFVFLLVGYGTKVGLVPLHNWLPDAHSEGPTPMSAVLSGLLLNVALYALVRIKMLVDASLQTHLAGYLMMGFGLLSFTVASLFLHRQHYIKRMFSYSSIEHMGLITFGFGMGGPLATFGALLHMTVHSLTKSAIFITVGHACQLAGTQRIDKIRGLIKTQPAIGWGLLIGTVAIAGFPPFGVFTSEFLLLTATMKSWPWLTVPLLVGLAIAFAGLFRHIHPMVYGDAPAGQMPVRANMIPVMIQLAFVLWLGIAIPVFLSKWFEQA